MFRSSVAAAIAAILIAAYIVFAGEIKGAPSVALALFPLMVATLAVAVASTQPWRVKDAVYLGLVQALFPVIFAALHAAGIAMLIQS